MQPAIRAVLAAAAHAVISGRKVAGVYDHAAGRHLRLAAESRGGHLQGFDGERSVRFGGKLPEIYDAGSRAYASLTIDGTTARGHDRASASDYEVRVRGATAQLYDHAQGGWFAFDIHSV